jgi:hypothetical protein
LSRQIAGFDFFPWLVLQAAAGAEAVAFDIREPRSGKFTLDEVARRYQSILKPGPALAGMASLESHDGIYYAPGGQQELVDFAKAGKKFPRLKSVLPPGKEKYTVTLRRTRRWPNRNSREDGWRTFAVEIGAKVIEDYDVQPIHLHERMALYAGAEMNFFVTNGPVMLCFLSEYPCMGFDVQNSPMIPLGIPMGEPYPYLLDQHRQIYEPDTLENIRKHFDAWLKGRWV